VTGVAQHRRGDGTHIRIVVDEQNAARPMLPLLPAVLAAWPGACATGGEGFDAR